MSYQSTATLEELAARIRAAKTIVCTSHEKPDGDAVGSVLALIRALGPTKEIQGWLLGSVPPAMEAMTEVCIERYERFSTAGQAGKIKPISISDMAKRYQDGSLDPKIN